MKQRIINVYKGEGTRTERIVHQTLLAAILLAFAIVNGFLALRLAACSYAPLYHPAVYESYFNHPPIVLLNILPAVLLMALGYFLTRRPWAAYLISAVPTIGFALVNYYKIQLRGDPFLAADFRLLRTAGGIISHYHLDLSRVVLDAVAGGGLMFLFALFLLRNGFRNKWLRLGGTVVCLALMPLLYAQVYMDGVVGCGGLCLARVLVSVHPQRVQGVSRAAGGLQREKRRGGARAVRRRRYFPGKTRGRGGRDGGGVRRPERLPDARGHPRRANAVRPAA